MRIGIIVNPSSGRDIRRILAHASVFPTGEKINVVVRLLAGLGALGVHEALLMPDSSGIATAIAREAGMAAQARGQPFPAVHILAMPISDTVEDTYQAVGQLCEQGVGAIAVLGGDGTHQAVAHGCGDTPLLALSTGTNNAFPDMREATNAGMATALVLANQIPPEVAFRQNKRLRVTCRDQHGLALVDVCVARQPFLGARAVWQPHDLERLFVTFAEPGRLGLSAIAGWAMPVARNDPWGAQLTFGAGQRVRTPIAPGLVETVEIATIERLQPHTPISIQTGMGTVSLDGERMIALNPGDTLTVELDLHGPRTIAVDAVLRYAGEQGLLTSASITSFPV